MKLYVCYGTFPTPLHRHPCEAAHSALREAGHEPQVVRSYGFGPLPGALQPFAGRRRAKELTGRRWVPVLELDDGTAVGGSEAIVAWARAHPATAS